MFRYLRLLGMLPCFLSVSCTILLIHASDSAAAVITENNTGNSLSGCCGSIGQSFVTPGGGPWNSIRFNWLMPDGPSASGTLYLLTEEYLGSSLDLGSSTPGFLASSVDSVDGHYVFDVDVTLLPSTTYWAITDVVTTSSRRFSSDDVVPGQLYFSSANNLNVRSIGGDTVFRVQGEVVPEASSATLIAMGLFALCGNRRQRRRSKQPS